MLLQITAPEHGEDQAAEMLPNLSLHTHWMVCMAAAVPLGQGSEHHSAGGRHTQDVAASNLLSTHCMLLRSLHQQLTGQDDTVNAFLTVPPTLLTFGMQQAGDECHHELLLEVLCCTIRDMSFCVRGLDCLVCNFSITASSITAT